MFVDLPVRPRLPHREVEGHRVGEPSRRFVAAVLT
jgi:hypothetical protein